MSLENKFNPQSMDIISEVGVGTFGVVYSVKDKSSGNISVMKKIEKVKVKKDRIMSEIDTLKYIMPICMEYLLCYEGFFEDDKYYYIYTELLKDYIPLSQYTRICNESMIIYDKIVRNLVIGLIVLHKYGVVHRDIKPDNIMINRDNGNIKYIDFGFACFKECESLRMAGTYKYMAPEIAIKSSGKKNTIKDYMKADIWSLGIVIYGLLTGKTPYEIWYNKNKAYINMLLKRNISTDEIQSVLTKIDEHKLLDKYMRDTLELDILRISSKNISRLSIKLFLLCWRYKYEEDKVLYDRYGLNDMLQHDPTLRKLVL